MIYLARHGETTWNMIGRYQGRQESALSALGVRQATALGDYFYERLARGERVPSRVISSPLLRCTATAQVTATRLGLPLETDERLIEIAHGTWEGRLRDELAQNDPQRYHTWRHDPATVSFEGGESLRDVDARWRAFAASLAGTEEDVLIASHDAVVRIAILAAEERPLDDFWKVKAENGAFARFTPDRPQWQLLEECHVEHLADARASIAKQAL
ncbi:MAG TPA: histidine phosphatase family protein [Candidatus Acidoferrales bacterium]|nr:histidine phosphatase family protein [Candidatus Acidoferrales bacterium]